jgi:hypothetical protein
VALREKEEDERGHSVRPLVTSTPNSQRPTPKESCPCFDSLSRSSFSLPFQPSRTLKPSLTPPTLEHDCDQCRRPTLRGRRSTRAHTSFTRRSRSSSRSSNRRLPPQAANNISWPRFSMRSSSFAALREHRFLPQS